MKREKTTVETLGVSAAAKILEGDRRAAARLIRDLDDDVPGAHDALSMLLGHSGHSLVVGITGAPGAGKSTLVDALIERYRLRKQTVGVLAMDPSSALSGGAILGDRIRMQRHATDEGVFIRSFASRGQLGGLARSTFDALAVLDALEIGIVFVETVGVGQDEMDIARMADITVVVTVPGLGDGVQAIKSGLLEMADILVVNKSDLPGADMAIKDLQTMLSMRQTGPQDVPLLGTSSGDAAGLDVLVTTIEEARRSKRVAERSTTRRTRGAIARVRQIVEQRLQARVDEAAGGDAGWEERARAVLRGDLTLTDAADDLVSKILRQEAED